MCHGQKMHGIPILVDAPAFLAHQTIYGMLDLSPIEDLEAVIFPFLTPQYYKMLVKPPAIKSISKTCEYSGDLNITLEHTPSPSNSSSGNNPFNRHGMGYVVGFVLDIPSGYLTQPWNSMAMSNNQVVFQVYPQHMYPYNYSHDVAIFIFVI